MKKTGLLILLSIVLLRANADEGMWLPMLLGQQVYDDMVKKGLKLTKDQLYNINKASIKDAVVIFGTGCTGEMVSNEGLVFTNHHCGYSAIAAVSTMEHNYLKDGFWAFTKDQEIPSNNLSVSFLDRIEDLTKTMDSSLNGLSGADRFKRQTELIAELNSKYSDTAQGIEAKLSSLFKGNQFLLFVYKVYKDVRFVGAAPETVGNFGGDTDNWEWPRHTGDFSVFRVYASKDGKPSNYNSANQPLKPKYFLPLSVKGFKEGDYAMIYGYPGSTNRYETSYGVKLKTDIEDPTRVTLREMRMKAIMEQMKKDPATRLKLAASYRSIANYWKFYDGESRQLKKYNVYEQKQKEEGDFQVWAKGKPEYESIFSDWGKIYEAWRPYEELRWYINEGILGSPLVSFGAGLIKVERALLTHDYKPEEIKKIFDDIDAKRTSFLASEDKASDQKIMATATRMYYENIDKGQHPIGFYETLKANFGDLKADNTYRNYAASVFSNSFIFNDAKWKDFLQKQDAVVLQEDPLFIYVAAFIKNYDSKYYPLFQQFNGKNNDLSRIYLKGVIQQNGIKKMYPDATFTMRVTYGAVKSYSPNNAIRYDYACTMKGVLEKYKPGDAEFDLSPKFLDLAKKKDFGRYIDKGRNDLVVTFITNTDITGGNSGSPVINGNGELIGISFDGNYEALSHKIEFDKDLNRTINVDIRYVLWCIDKLGGAQNIIRELKIQ